MHTQVAIILHTEICSVITLNHIKDMLREVLQVDINYIRWKPGKHRKGKQQKQ